MLPGLFCKAVIIFITSYLAKKADTCSVREDGAARYAGCRHRWVGRLDISPFVGFSGRRMM